MSVKQQIETALRNSFDPHQLDVRDDSEKHRGHAGYQEGGESHFHVTLRAASLAGKSRLARHRAVHDSLGAAIMSRIHALSLDVDG